jgi:hypothetical protein
MILILSTLVGCGSSTEDLEAVDYTPLAGEDWTVSTPAEQGLDPMFVAELYHNAAEMETLYGLLVIKNGYLIAEGYFNEGAIDRKNQLQSATKSYTSALLGLALNFSYECQARLPLRKGDNGMTMSFSDNRVHFPITQALASSPTNSPCSTSKSIPLRTVFNPKRLTNFLTFIICIFCQLL